MTLLAALALNPKLQAAIDAVTKVWNDAGSGTKISVVAVGLLLLAFGVGFVLLRVLHIGWRKFLLVLTVASLAGAVGLGTWAYRLPEHHGTYFDLGQQIVRVCAAVCATAFVFCSMLLLLPVALNRVERSSAIGFVAARHVRATKSGFLTVISVLSIAGVAVSSLALCAVISIMGGFGADLKRKILGNNAHISVDRDNVGGFGDWDRALDEVRLTPGVVAATPVAGGEAMASSNSNTAGVLVRGVESETVATVIDLVNNIEAGSFKYLADPAGLLDIPPDTIIGLGPGGQPYRKGPALKRVDELDPSVAEILLPDDIYPGLILGRELAKSLHVLVGDELSLVAPLGDLGPMGVMPRTRRFRVAGIFYSGMYEYDSSHVYMDLSEAQDFLDLRGHITQMDVKVTDAENVTAVRDAVASTLASRNLRVRDWKELNRNLFSALKLEKLATFVILCIAITVACFCIVCTLLLMVTEKSKEIAVIKALGASDRMVLRIFMSEGVIIGGIGAALGVTTGWVLCFALQRLGVKLDPEVYYVDRLPIEVNLVDYSLIAICTIAITVLATLYPALSASRVRPVDGIRYE
jgi:lipoprotein-releasing system permease protein